MDCHAVTLGWRPVRHARGNIPWPEVYDTNKLITGARLDRPLVVDVGGSKGHDLEKFHQKHPDIPQGTLVLQDLPEVLNSLTVDPAISICPHDSFASQPIKGAGAYYFHLVLHDWPDDRAAEILGNTADAMEPRILQDPALRGRRKCAKVLYPSHYPGHNYDDVFLVL
ncbi:O-methyltransferase-domain-containing protein [Xylaria arbuscula]|nr:O-methyltransferase-domain-containing protein [Xylaria arbuscula]